MHYVSLIVEFLRGRPAVVFWTVALTQAALWTLMPTLFYSAPPGEVPIFLAIGHEFQLGSYLGPPLAFWLGEIAFRLGGVFGVLSAGAGLHRARLSGRCSRSAAPSSARRHAVLAVLLMAGIAAFTVPARNSAPAIMAAPFWALALLHYWRALGEDKRGYWFLLAIDLGLLLLANYVGVILVALLALFTLASRRGRAALAQAEPWIALLAVRDRDLSARCVALRDARAGARRHQRQRGGRRSLPPALRLAATLIGAHLGVGPAGRAGERLAARSGASARPRSTAIRSIRWRACSSMSSR